VTTGQAATTRLPFPLSVAPVRGRVLALIVVGQVTFIAVGMMAAPVFAFLQSLAHDPAFRLVGGFIAVLGFAVIVPGGMLWWGGLRPRDIGLEWVRVPGALLATLAVWGMAQAGAAGLALFAGAPLAVDRSWMASGLAWTLLAMAGHVAMVVFPEEVVHRGFLFPQLSLWLKERVDLPVVPSVLLGFLVSQALFALAHLPLLSAAELANRAPESIGMTFVMSVVIATIYTMSRNLFLAMGIHLLINLPTPLVAVEPYMARLLVLCAGLIVAGFIASLRDEPQGARKGA
jgi:membrane protease YdiL (CAAX protease family)